MYDAIRELTRTFPVVSALLDQPPEHAVLTPSQDRDPRESFLQMVSAFCTLVDRCQEVSPLLFVFDDLQWCDEESLELLSAWFTRSVSSRVMVLGLTHCV